MSLLSLLLFTACLPEFDERRFPEDPLTDFDGDGFTVDDCDDTNATVYPGADELCDFIDNNCNGSVDELAVDAQLWYADIDGDGFGLEQYVIESCTIPDNYAPARFDPDGNPLFDCDDDPINGQGASVNPLAQETCTPFDDNCNGLINENDPLMNEALVPSWYLDRDFDGYGGDFEQDVITSCDQPSLDYRLAGGDCDDLNPYVNPSASERCDEVDNDCDGLVDEGDPDVIIDAFWYPDNDGDGFGDSDPSVAFIASCVQPEGYVLPNTDCNDNNPGISPEGFEICDGFDNDCDGEIDDGVTNMYFLDVDGDGYGRRFDTDGDGIVDDFDNDGLPDNFKEACEAPIDPATGHEYVGNFDDCDDNNPNVNPAAQEICDNIDNDCNGLTDGTDVGPNGTPWYLDSDGDGFGSRQIFRSCTQPIGYVDNDEDCDDTRASVNPDAQESCLTIFDDNCDYETSLSTDIEHTNDIGAIGCTDFYEDKDGDGFGAGQGQCTCEPDPEGKYVSPLNTDCDDEKPEVNPGQLENCYTNLDDNCNGSNNDSGAIYCTNFFFDNDLDGYGITGDSVCTCIPTGLYSAQYDGDCLDTNFYINPGVDEVCDGLDNNCDGVTDLSDAVDARTWYIDQDQDGYGSPESINNSIVQNPIVQCFSPGTQYLLNDLDCDDQVPTINPGIVETCNTAYDDDCDGSVNREDADGCIDVYQDLDGDGFGDIVSICTCSVTTDYPTFESGDCDEADATISPDVDEVCDGFFDENCDGLVDEQDAVGCVNYFSDTDGDGEGAGLPSCLCSPTALYSVEVAGDCNDQDANVSRAANNCSTDDILKAGSAPHYVTSSLVVEHTQVMDVNGDGHDDLVLGLPTDEEQGTSSGAVEVFLAPFSTVLTTGVNGNSDVRLVRQQGSDNAQVGRNVLLGQFDGDAQGLIDALLVGASDYTIVSNGLGTGEVLLDSAGIQSQQHASDFSNAFVIGDVDGDGFDNVITTVNGVSELWDGNTNFASTGLVLEATLTIEVVNSLRNWDVNGDGVVDLLVYDGAQYGIVFGGNNAYNIDVILTTDGTPKTIGDMNGDGTYDWVVQNPEYAPEVSESGLGTFTAIDLGSADFMSYQNQTLEGLFSVVGEYHAGLTQSATYSVSQSQFGKEVFSIGDFNGDGFEDAVVQNGLQVDHNGTQNCSQNWYVVYGGNDSDLSASSLDAMIDTVGFSTIDCVNTASDFHLVNSATQNSSMFLMTINTQATTTTGWFNGVVLVSEQ